MTIPLRVHYHGPISHELDGHIGEQRRRLEQNGANVLRGELHIERWCGEQRDDDYDRVELTLSLASGREVRVEREAEARGPGLLALVDEVFSFARLRLEAQSGRSELPLSSWSARVHAAGPLAGRLPFEFPHDWGDT